MTALTLVVPCFNEARRLNGPLWLAAVHEYEWLSLLFVDDGSTDETATVLQDLCTQRPERIAQHRLPQNAGKAEAVRQGLLTAIDAGSTLIGFWDADLATPLSEVPILRQVLLADAQITLVMGARVRMMGRDIRRVGRRHYAGRIFASVASMALGVPVYDTQCGAKLMLANEPVKQALATPFSSKWIFDVQLLARLLAQVEPWAIREVPLTHWEDVAGSKLSTADFATAATDLLGMRKELRLARRRGRS